MSYLYDVDYLRAIDMVNIGFKTRISRKKENVFVNKDKIEQIKSIFIGGNSYRMFEWK